MATWGALKDGAGVQLHAAPKGAACLRCGGTIPEGQETATQWAEVKGVWKRWPLCLRCEPVTVPGSDPFQEWVSTVGETGISTYTPPGPPPLPAAKDPKPKEPLPPETLWEWARAHPEEGGGGVLRKAAAPPDESEDGLYFDGGVIGKNPSTEGGVWAWVRVKGGKVEAEESGRVAPSDLGVTAITNNHMEVLALLNGLWALPTDWCGRVSGDSAFALGVVFEGWKANSVPTRLFQEIGAVLARVGWSHIERRILEGHPTRKDLEAGIGSKRGLPVSRWNVRCDALCNERKKKPPKVP